MKLESIISEHHDLGTHLKRISEFAGSLQSISMMISVGRFTDPAVHGGALLSIVTTDKY